MKDLVNLLFAAIVVPVFMLAPESSKPASPQPQPSAEAIQNAVILAHDRALEAGGRPGPIRRGG